MPVLQIFVLKILYRPSFAFVSLPGGYSFEFQALKQHSPWDSLSVNLFVAKYSHKNKKAGPLAGWINWIKMSAA